MYSGGEYGEAAASQAYQQQQQQQLYEQQQTQPTQQFDLTQQQTLASYDQTGQYDQPPTPVNMVTRVRVTRARVRAAAAAAAPQPPGLCAHVNTLVSSVACLPEVSRVFKQAQQLIVRHHRGPSNRLFPSVLCFRHMLSFWQP
jgi:hypothetical protein